MPLDLKAVAHQRVRKAIPFDHRSDAVTAGTAARSIVVITH